MRYLALESLSHLTASDLSREAVKKHQNTVLEQLKVSGVTVCMYNVAYVHACTCMSMSSYRFCESTCMALI